MTAVGCEHSQDVALRAVVDCNDVMTRMLLSAVADLAFPHGLSNIYDIRIDHL